MPRTITIWTLTTHIPGDPDPIDPAVFSTEEAARKGFDVAMRAEWESLAPSDKETDEPLPYPGDPDEAHAYLAEDQGDPDEAVNPGEIWGRYSLAEHQLVIDD